MNLMQHINRIFKLAANADNSDKDKSTTTPVGANVDRQAEIEKFVNKNRSLLERLLNR